VLLAAFDELDPDLRETFENAGWMPKAVEELLGAAGAGSVDERGHLFRFFSDDSKHLLSSAAKIARSGSAHSVSAAHLFQACLQSQTRIERAAGIPASRARIVLRSRGEDLSRVEGGPLSIDDALTDFLRGLAPGSDSLAMLARFHAGGTPELAQVLARHKVSGPLLERARGAFQDPA
jgi:hypothetical protein